MKEVVGLQGPLALLAHGLVKADYERTQTALGDRSAYVGLSDVAKGISCLRSAIAAKIQTERQNQNIVLDLARSSDWGGIQQILNRSIILQRGHWLEDGIEAAFQAGDYPFLSQLEIIAPDRDVPLRAHLDFVLIRPGPRPAIRVIELKSMGNLPGRLYAGYEAQLYGQLGLLAAHWNKPVFSIRLADGTLVAQRTFPEIASQILNLSLPDRVEDVEIDGFVLGLSMTEAKAFGPYRPSTIISDLVQRTAGKIWRGMMDVKAGVRSLNDLSICPGFHPLCDYCPHAQGCPKFASLPITDAKIDTELDHLLKLKQQKKKIEAETDRLEERIRSFCTRLHRGSDWLQTSLFRFKSSPICGRSSLDPQQLRSILANHLQPEHLDAAFQSATRQGNSYERLSVSRL